MRAPVFELPAEDISALDTGIVFGLMSDNRPMLIDVPRPAGIRLISGDRENAVTPMAEGCSGAMNRLSDRDGARYLATFRASGSELAGVAGLFCFRDRNVTGGAKVAPLARPVLVRGSKAVAFTG